MKTFLAAGLMFLVYASPSRSLPLVDDCDCEVLNTTRVTVAPGTCTLPGGGSVPCFTASQPTFPNGNPRPGVCKDVGDCHGGGSCSYVTMAVTVTISACASTGCLTGNPVPYKWVDGTRGGAYGNVPAPGTQLVNTQLLQTAGPGGFGIECGTEEQQLHLRYLKPNGLTAFEVTYSYGCGSCAASR